MVGPFLAVYFTRSLPLLFSSCQFFSSPSLPSQSPSPPSPSPPSPSPPSQSPSPPSPSTPPPSPSSPFSPSPSPSLFHPLLPLCTLTLLLPLPLFSPSPFPPSPPSPSPPPPPLPHPLSNHIYGVLFIHSMVCSWVHRYRVTFCIPHLYQIAWDVPSGVSAQ